MGLCASEQFNFFSTKMDFYKGEDNNVEAPCTSIEIKVC